MSLPSTTDVGPALARNVSLQFASRPTFEQAAQRMLEQAIQKKYPQLNLDLGRIQLATPDATHRAWQFQPFMPRVLDYLAQGVPLDLRPQGNLDCYLSDVFPRRLRSGDEKVDIKVVEKLVLELPWTVPIDLEDELTRYWSGDLGTEGSVDMATPTSRWQWLSDVLRNLLSIRALQQPDLTDAARAALDQVVRWPDRAQRLGLADQVPVHAYSLETRLTQGTSSSVLPSGDILLTYVTQGSSALLLCSPGSVVRAFPSLEAFDKHWGESIARRYVVDTVTCVRHEIDGHAFDSQAAMLLEQQLAELRRVRLPSRIGLQALKTLYRDLTDPARFLLDEPTPVASTSARLKPLVPAWLQKASVVDQTTFQHLSLALASAKKRHQGRTFLSDVQDIETFTTQALLERMRQANDSHPDPVPASQFLPGDIVLTFTVSAGYPGTIGITQEQRMSLVELAIKNLVARPSGNAKLSHRLGLALPAWLTTDFISRKGGLIEQVDIGANYPRYLQEQLLGGTPQVQARQRMFAEQIPAQLRLEALKQALNNEDGMTREGLRVLEALLQQDAQANDRAVTLRPLAVLRKPQARPDVVTNMFVIEAQDTRVGPHLLYRPLYTPALQQFPTREALLQAITRTGALQDSVLTWMTDAARPVYANGGFLEPHIVRFFPGDEFSAPDKPAPATLATDDALAQSLLRDELMPYLYDCNARALVIQADRTSVSNSESRWAVLLEGGSLLFNTLLTPLLRGPAMTTFWLWSLMASASHDIPALSNADPIARELAAVDLLVNLAMLVMQFPATHAPAHEPLAESIADQTMQLPAPRAIAERWPAPPPPSIVESTVALPGERAETAGKILDVSFSSARHRLTPDQRSRLLRLQVPRPASLPDPIEYGPYTGLYVIANQWHALVEESLYRISPEADGSAIIIDPLDPSKRGPSLRADGHGHWNFDLRLRLLGGAPPKRQKDLSRLNIQRATELVEELEQCLAQDRDRQKAVDVAQEVLTRLEEGAHYTEAQRAPKRKLFYDLLTEQIDRNLKLLKSAPERASLNIPLPAELVRALMENVVNGARKAFLVTVMEDDALNATHSHFHGEQGVIWAFLHDQEGYFRFLETKSDIHERSIHWLELKDEYLEKLLNLDAAGAQVYERLTKDRPLDERDAIGTRALQLTTLPILAINHPGSDLTERMLHLVKPLALQIRSHTELRHYELPPAEQLEVLGSLTEYYGKTLDALQGMKTLYADDLNELYFDKLLKLVDSLYQDVSGKLAALVKPEPKPRRRPPKRAKAQAERLQKKVIKTRHSGVLIGDLKPAGTDLPIETVELRSQVNNEVLATYSRHEDVWDVVDVRRPAPAPVPATRSIKVIKRAARALLDELEERLRRAQSYQKYCRHPQEIEEIMNNEADRFRVVDEELGKALAASPASRTPADQALSEQLVNAIGRLRARGSQLRTELSLQLPPTDGNLTYLFEKNLIQVALLGERKPLKGARKDFLQEYAINDRDGFPLWYAHFHYEKADTPKADYSVAHLKTKEQRREHYQSLLAKADNPYAVVNVHRGQIGKALAQGKFLPLAP
ncbi:dermonecrotic toxin domain-containing protein [Pseudomonas citrulli]|uniref:Dermonecrotic toxin N-terminal domain-containing protein n=1 Tax=Pseudomonas citrulli TaxID=3064347 RepID=A0ABT9C2I4_9PSED|nr:DUF6543 domain-containing protein [Pseudomonas sp. K18]MDO7898981.1 hypothetical protein [Pseudomonas sp. K18]